jgi:hypothetical protein
VIFAVANVDDLHVADEKCLAENLSGRNACMNTNIAIKFKISKARKLIYLSQNTAQRLLVLFHKMLGSPWISELQFVSYKGLCFIC